MAEGMTPEQKQQVDECRAVLEHAVEALRAAGMQRAAIRMAFATRNHQSQVQACQASITYAMGALLASGRPAAAIEAAIDEVRNGQG